MRVGAGAVILAGLLLFSSVTGPVTGAGAGAGAATAAGNQTPCTGRIASPAGGLTIVSVQGARYTDNGSYRTNARIIAYGPNGAVEWIHRSGQKYDMAWSYDVDPMPNGDLFVTATKPGDTIVYELNTTTGKREWVERLETEDAHDADLIAPDRIVVANMRAYNRTRDVNSAGIFIYNLTTDRVVWRWRFTDHYNRSVGDPYAGDWTHTNDVDQVGEDRFLISPRDFDQVVLVNRTTGDIELRLGSDNNYSILRRQHNPDYLESEDGNPTFLVADSENDRAVEYEHTADGWERTWTVGTDETLSWPRDADRLANGNTLIADSRNNRVVEVTPEGEVVWEVYAPWLVYEVERLPGDSSTGPTMRDAGAPESPRLRNASPPSVAALERCNAALLNMSNGFEAEQSQSIGGVLDGLSGENEEQTREFAPQSDDHATQQSDRKTIASRDAGGLLAATVIVLLVVAWWRRR